MYASNDVVKFTVHQVYDSQLCLNTFFYKMNDPVITFLTPAEFAEIFWGWVQEDWRGIVSTSVTFEKITVENLDGDLSYGEWTIPAVERYGEATGQPQPAFMAYAIQLNRTSRLTRQGAKRLVGVNENLVDSYGVLTVACLDLLQEVADSFALDLSVNLITYAYPVIVGFPTPDRPVRVEVPFNTATAKTIVSTQNTRKRGSGS